MVAGRRCAIALVVAGISIGFAGSGASRALANTIGPNCGTCQGSTYTLTYTVENVNGGNTTYDVTLSIDTAGFSPSGSGSGPSYIDSVAVKVSGADPLDPTALDIAPGSLSYWVMHDGGISAHGCSGAGSGFECATSEGGSAGVVGSFNETGGTLAWVWDITLPTGGLNTSANGASIKVRYVNGSDHKVGELVSEGITLTTPATPAIPAAEPATTLLLAVAVVAGCTLRKKLLGL